MIGENIKGTILQLPKKYGEKLHAPAIPESYLADKDKIKTYDIKITDEVYIVGYPSTYKLQHHLSNFPFVTEGMIASRIGEPLEDEHKGKGWTVS